MRIIHVKSGRSFKLYKVYETRDEANENEPNSRVKAIAEAEEGDLVESDNGWIVPLLRKTTLYSKRVWSRGKKYDRKTQIKSYVYHFPKQKICIRENKISDYIFDYIPKNNDNLSGDDKKMRLYELSPRKILWARLVEAGLTIEEAVQRAFPNVRNKTRLLKSLLLNDKLMGYLKQTNDSSIKDALKSAGITTERIADTMLDVLNNSKNFNEKKWVVEMALKVWE